MGEYFLDYEGAHNAKAQFKARSVDLSGAAHDVEPAGLTTGQVTVLAEQLMIACAGRMYAYSDELSMLTQLVEDVVQVTNQVDVAYVIR